MAASYLPGDFSRSMSQALSGKDMYCNERAFFSGSAALKLNGRVYTASNEWRPPP